MEVRLNKKKSITWKTFFLCAALSKVNYKYSPEAENWKIIKVKIISLYLFYIT
jgi:hypothetical protein